MLDPISISIAVSACIVAILTHLKFSRCCGFEMKTRNVQKDGVPDSPNTPLLEK